MKPHKKIVLIAALTLLLVIGGIITFQPTGMREVKSFKHGICQAFMPECGICPGTIIDGKCYVMRGTFEQYR